MDRVTLQNYRCFRDKQSARLAPLTFLVGENSTGKTSFLALLRALWQVAFEEITPDFRETPYDMGAFEDIAHRGANGNSETSFNAEFKYALSPAPDDRISYRVMFEDRGGYPFPCIRRFSNSGTWLEVDHRIDWNWIVRFGNGVSQYEHKIEYSSEHIGTEVLFPLEYTLREVWHDTRRDSYRTPDYDKQSRTIDEVHRNLDRLFFGRFRVGNRFPPFASAPIRSRPRRTYDPSRPTPDPEGEYIPDYLASMSRNIPEKWERLKSDLENFGRDSGLFDEIAVLSFGKTAGSPFQMQIRKFGKRLKGPKRNLIDVGYGVSQALPILTELLREDSPKMFLLQQPEVHLHPRAQAALGSLFCNLAASGKQIIVETHSDYILDRARMDIRDGKTGLKPDDISVLYFERDELDVNIHSLRVDEDGNVLDAPPGYGQFFMDEMRRSVGL